MDTKKKVKETKRDRSLRTWRQMLKEYEAWMEARQKEERETWINLMKEYDAWMEAHPEKIYCPASLFDFLKLLDDLEQNESALSSLPMESIQ
jgi:hypothetical protein